MNDTTVYRTPDARFDDLPGYPFAPHYVTTDDGLRLHVVDEGEGPPVVCLHGEPTWSYLYRHVIADLADDHRVVAPDFPGFGRSDKPTDRNAYTLDLHLDALHTVVEARNVTGATLVVQDWGGLIGLTYAARHPERIARLVILNTFLPVGEAGEKSEAFLQWRRFVETHDDFPVSLVVRRGLADSSRLSDAEAAAYDAPFPTPESKAGAVAWPLLVPITPDDPVADAMRDTRRRLADWQKPVFVLFAPGDPILGGAHPFFRELIPTASAQPEVFIDDAAHFLQEEQGPQIASHVRAFIERTG
jgi:haloalkane dehalogenase